MGRSRGVEPQQRQAAGRLVRLLLVLVRRIVLSRAPDAANSSSRRYAGRGGPAVPAAGKKGGLVKWSSWDFSNAIFSQGPLKRSGR